MNELDKAELAKMDAEDARIKEMNERYIKETVESIKELNKINMSYYFSKPIKYKKPFKVRFNEFKEKLRKVIE